MNQEDRVYFIKKLEDEKKLLVEELSRLGQKNQKNPKKWETTYSDLNATVGADEVAPEADPIDQSDLIEEYEARSAVEAPLEARFNNVQEALDRVAKGTYGICRYGTPKHPIERERLEANPAALSCIEHLGRTS